MKILFLTSSMGGGGAERVAALLSNAWSARGDTVILMPTFSGRGMCSYVLDPRVEIDYLADHVNGARGKLRRLWALRRQIRERKPDIVVSFLTNVNVAALLAGIATGVPVIVSERNYLPTQSQTLGLVLNFLWRRTYPWAAAVVSQSEDTSAWITKECPKSNNIVIGNPLHFPMSVAEPMVPPQNILTDGRKCIVVVGRFDAVKRFDLLIESFAQVAVSHQDWDLVILGDGARRAALQAQIEAAGLENRVFMPGFVGNLGDWYARSNIYAMASAVEGFPNTLLEAMAHGLPAIAFDIKTGPREIMLNGDAGILLPDDDHVRRLTDALDMLMKEDERRLALGQIASNVRERYSMPRVLELWDEVFSKAVS